MAMRTVSRWVLGLVTSAIPVVIAACYGVAYTFTQRGRVVDKSTKAGVGGLRVDCRSASGDAGDIEYTATDGQFSLFAISANSCVSVRVTDEREVGTHYATTTVRSNPGETLTIEVAP